jgi:hypothetical protein
MDDGADCGGFGWEFDVFDGGIHGLGAFQRCEEQEMNEN